jgi:hypothetical protein
MLNEMRYGTLSPKSIARFRQLSREIVYEDGIGPTELYATVSLDGHILFSKVVLASRSVKM